MFTSLPPPAAPQNTSSTLIAAAQAALPPGQNVPQLTAQDHGEGGVDPSLSGPQIAAQELIKSVEAGHMQAETAQALIAQVGDVDLVNLDEIEAQVRQSSTRKMVELVERHPEEAVSIMRTWMFEDA
jgi:hypothetical protein